MLGEGLMKGLIGAFVYLRNGEHQITTIYSTEVAGLWNTYCVDPIAVSFFITLSMIYRRTARVL